MEKNHKSLEVALRAYENRLSSLVELLAKLKKYPNAREEKVRLVVQQQHITDTQTLLEGPPMALPKGPMSLKPTLDTISEVSLQKENTNSESQECGELRHREIFEPIDLEEILEANEEMALNIWKVVQKRVDDDQSGRFTPPFPFVEANRPLEDRWVVDSLNRHTATLSQSEKNHEEL